MAEALSYQEMLRTFGTLLDQADSKTATLKVSDEGVQIFAPSWPWPRTWDIESIMAQAAAQRAWRLNPRSRRIPRAGRSSKRLRVVGAALDLEGEGPFLIMVEPNVVRVEGRKGYRRSFDQRPLSRRVRLAPHLRGQLATP